MAALKQLFAQHSEPYLKTVCSVSVGDDGQKGAFALYALPAGAAVQTSPDLLFPSIGVRTNDGFLVGPGSTIADIEFRFANTRSEVAPAPAWLMEICGVQLPESKTMTNVVPLKQAATPADIHKSKMDWALEAAQYIPVHPLRWYVDPGANAAPEEQEKAAKAAKASLLNDWPNRATQDFDQIRKWWKQWPQANIGGSTNNLVVVDIDTRSGGDDTFAALQAVETFPDTATTRTHSGGRHLIYVAPDGPVKGGTHALGPGVDVKARGGYVVMPGSTIDGRMYARESARPAAFAPPWIIQKLKAARPKTDAAGKRVVEEDETAVEMATQWMLKHAPTAEYGAIDDTTYKVAARLYDFGVTEHTALEIMHEWNELKCSPPGDLERLEVVVGSAGRNREKRNRQ